MRVFAVDGRSGAGKTRFAGALADALGAPLVHLEDFYPGWQGLADGAAWLAREVLAPLRRGERVQLRRWDWRAEHFVAGEWLAPPKALVVEGCGALSRASQPLIDVGIWLEADAQLRHERAHARDGDDGWWADWAAQEEAFYAAERSLELANVIGV